MQTKRVVILHLAHWDQLLGGSEQQLRYLSDFLIEKGYEVHFIYLDRTPDNVELHGVIEHPIKHIRFPGKLGKYWFIYKRCLLKELNKIRPDILVTRTESSWSGIASQYAQYHGKKHIHYIASDHDVVFPALQKYRVFDLLERRLYKKVFSASSEVICQNHFQRSKIRSFFNINAHLQTQAAPAPNNTAIENKDPEKITIIWVSNMKPLKRPEKFIKLVEFLKNNKKLRFVMVGGDPEGRYKSILEDVRKQSNFVYKGPLSNDEVNNELEYAHILVNTSDYEGFPNTFVQAWMRGIFVLSLNSDPDFILEKHGVGKKLDSIQAIATEINDLSLNPELLREKGLKSRKYALDNHQIDTVYSQTFL